METLLTGEGESFCVIKSWHNYDGGTTSNLILHLNKMHPSSIQVKKVTATTQLSIKQVDTWFRKGKSRYNQPCSMKMQEITQILTKWTWTDRIAGKFGGEESLANWLFSSIWRKKDWWINRSANRLLIVSTNLVWQITDDLPNLPNFPPAKLFRYTVYEITISTVCDDGLKELVSFLVSNYWLSSTTYPSALI